MTLEKMGYRKEGSYYIKRVETYTIIVIPISDGYTRKITQGDQFVGIKKFTDVNEIESDRDYIDIINYLNSMKQKPQKKNIITSIEMTPGLIKDSPELNFKGKEEEE